MNDHEGTRQPSTSVPVVPQLPAGIDERLFSALLNEHFVLQTVRATTVSESSSRASIFLVTLSSSLVAFGFLAGTPHETAFLAFVLPIVFLLGLTSYARLVETSLEDVLALAGIQRIRRYYASLHPDASRFFPLPHAQSAPNEMLDTGRRAGWWGVFFTMSTSIGVVNAVVAGAGAYALVGRTSAPNLVPTAAALGTSIVVALGEAVHQEARYRAVMRTIDAMK